MQVSISSVILSAVAGCIPKNQFDLLSLSKQFGKTEIERIIQNTGIHSIRLASSKTSTADLCVAAAQSLFARCHIDANSIDGLVFVTQTPDKIMPGTSFLIHGRLRLKKSCVVLDINQGCTGYIYGLYIASLLIQAGGCQRVLILAGDTLSRYIHPEDKSTRMVFGDGASASLLEKSTNCEDKLFFSIQTDGSGSDFLKMESSHDAYLFMNGYKIMEFALKEVPLIIDSVLEITSWKKDEVETFLLHQANVFMLHYLRNKINIPTEKMPIAINGIGNTSSASIPITLCTHAAYLKQKNALNKVLMCGFGVGLSWGACTLNMKNSLLIPTIEF